MLLKFTNKLLKVHSKTEWTNSDFLNWELLLFVLFGNIYENINQIQ